MLHRNVPRLQLHSNPMTEVLMQDTKKITAALRLLADAIDDWSEATMERTAIQAEPSAAPEQADPQIEASFDDTSPAEQEVSMDMLRGVLDRLAKEYGRKDVANVLAGRKLAATTNAERLQIMADLDKAFS